MQSMSEAINKHSEILVALRDATKRNDHDERRRLLLLERLERLERTLLSPDTLIRMDICTIGGQPLKGVNK